MNISEAMPLNGKWCRLILGDLSRGSAFTVEGWVVGVVVPAPGLGVEAHLLLRQSRDKVFSPCGSGLEVFLSDVVLVVWRGNEPLQQRRGPLLRVV
jgi:hypothetical protein